MRIQDEQLVFDRGRKTSGSSSFRIPEDSRGNSHNEGAGGCPPAPFDSKYVGPNRYGRSGK